MFHLESHFFSKKIKKGKVKSIIVVNVVKLESSLCVRKENIKNKWNSLLDLPSKKKISLIFWICPCTFHEKKDIY